MLKSLLRIFWYKAALKLHYFKNPKPNERELMAYFKNPANFYDGIKIRALIEAVGMYDGYYDDDRGHLTYVWYRKNFRVRANCYSDEVLSIEALNPTPSTRDYADMDDAIELLWSDSRVVKR